MLLQFHEYFLSVWNYNIMKFLLESSHFLINMVHGHLFHCVTLT
jgi:hypothetical protein